MWCIWRRPHCWATAACTPPQRAATSLGLVQLARAISVAVDRELNGSIDTLQALAASEHLDADNLARFDAQAKCVLSRHKTWATVLLADPSGQIVVDLLRPPDAALPAVGARKPAIIFMVVDLPAPLRPNSATTSPSPTSSAISNRICAGP